MSLITLGSDMELFAINKAGEHVALCGLIGGTKENPLQVEGMPTGFMVQEDNVAFEFNIPVFDSRDGFSNAFVAMRKHIAGVLSTLGLDMAKEASVSFSSTQLTHPNALIFGCEPDYSAWSKQENKKPYAKDANLRTAGGHIHVGTKINMIQGVQLMDLFLGVPSVLLDNTEASKARRELYGKAGAMRPKPYGFEYRVLSNFWMFSKELTDWVFNNTRTAMDSSHIEFTPALAAQIQEAINNSDEVLAKQLIATYNIQIPL